MKKQFDVYGIGNAIVDLQLRISEGDFSKLGLAKGGMALVDEDTQQGLLSSLASDGINQASGGSAANTIIALAQLGAKSAYGCVVGDDAFGKFYFQEMQELGVSLNTAPVAGATTGSSVILVTPDSERTMNTHLGISATFSEAHISEERIKSSEWLYVEGYLFTSETGQQAALKAVSLAKKHGTKVAVTFSDRFIVEFFSSPLREVVAQSDLIFANLHEAEAFTAKTDEDEIFRQLCDLVPNVALTMSERGAKIKIAETLLNIASPQVTAVDATGAGDIFAGGFLYGLTHNLSPEQTGKLACFLGAKVVSQLGPRVHGDLKATVQAEGII